MLTDDVEIVGVPVVELAHRSDNPHVDVFVRLSEVDGDGRSRNVSDALLRLEHADGPVRLELDAIAHRFAAGHRIRLVVAGGSHPRFGRNLGTGEPYATGSRMQASRRTIAHAGSTLTLPVSLDQAGGG